MTTGRMAMIRITELKLALDAAFDPPDTTSRQTHSRYPPKMTMWSREFIPVTA